MDYPAPQRSARSRKRRALQSIRWEELKGVASSSGCADPDAEFPFFVKTASVAPGSLRRLEEMESHLLDPPYGHELSMRIPCSEANTPEALQELKAAYLTGTEVSVSLGLFDGLFTEFQRTLGHSRGLRLFGFDAWEDSWSWDAGEADQQDVVYRPDFPTLLDPKASSWVAEVVHFASYLKDEFTAQTDTRRFRALVEKQRARVEQVLHEVGFSRQVEEYVRPVCIWGSLIRAATRSPQRYAGTLLERLRRLSNIGA